MVNHDNNFINKFKEYCRGSLPYLGCQLNERIAEPLNRRTNRIRYGEYMKDGMDIISEDWDNLIILDACRFDFFQEAVSIDGQLQERYSRASKTPEFIRATFSDRELLDTVYISANPWYGRLKDDINAKIFLYQSVKFDSFENTTCHPEIVTKTAVNAAEQYPNKRLIVHYLQPHDPYFDENGNELFELPSTCPWFNKFRGCSQEDIIQAYDANLSFVMTYVEKLVDGLQGKTVITADHGEMLGERMAPIPLRKYEHPEGIYVEPLLKVPWFELNYDERKNIVSAEEPQDFEGDEEMFEERLRNLGYLN